MQEALSNETRSKPCLGAQECAAQGWSFEDVFRHQFRISRSPSIEAPTWKRIKVGSYWIEHCPHLPVSEVRNRRGHVFGFCLGVAIDPKGQAIGADGSFLTVPNSFEAVEAKNGRLAGRYALVVRIGDKVRYYPDATSGLTAVANRSLRVIASTVTLAIDDEIQPSGGRSIEEITGAPNLYLMGETPDARVSQLRSNHYVDLSTFTPHRFWPKEETSFVAHDDLGQGVDRIANRLRLVMTSLVSNFSCTLPVTGGRDSRLLAAALSPEVYDQVGALHVHDINWATSYDVKSATLVAAHLGVPLKVKDVRGGQCAAELIDFDAETLRAQIALATGYVHPIVPGNVLQSMRVAPEAQLLLRGGAMEVAQANKWPKPGRIGKSISAEFAFQRLAGHPNAVLAEAYGEAWVERNLDKYKTWFARLPGAARNCAIDLGHMELWLSSGMGTVFYAPRKHFYVNPFSDQSLLHAAMRFGPKTRKEGWLVKALLDRFSPGLAEVPYAQQMVLAERR